MQHFVSAQFSFTCDVELLAVAGSALVFDCDPTFIIPRVCCSGRAELVRDGVFCGRFGVDDAVVFSELERVCQVSDVGVADSDLAAQGHHCPTLDRAAGPDCEADVVYDECRGSRCH